ncbi:MAG: hypothetical protein KBG48_19265 [Kofleriaceae bacterium]|nr:hypothetical protein [Kofleriaceae bacterium]MBP9169549.1 hypothetical protein [Kofleriaceae bacterium]MBP9859194.1 hypothetical protein [Kofleriaceae bacterium]
MSPKYAVAISYRTSDHRDYVTRVADRLREHLGDETVFYDLFCPEELARLNCDNYLVELFTEGCTLAVAIISDNYGRHGHEWTGTEWRSIKEKLKRDPNAVMLIGSADLKARRRLGLTDCDVIVPLTSFHTSEHLAAGIVSRLRDLQRHSSAAIARELQPPSLPEVQTEAIASAMSAFHDNHRHLARLGRLLCRYLVGLVERHLGISATHVLDHRTSEVLVAELVKKDLERQAWEDPTNSPTLWKVKGLVVARLVFFCAEHLDKVIASPASLRGALGADSVAPTDIPPSASGDASPWTRSVNICRGTELYRDLAPDDQARVDALEDLRVEVHLRTLRQHAELCRGHQAPPISSRAGLHPPQTEPGDDPNTHYSLLADFESPPLYIKPILQLFSIDETMGSGYRAHVWSSLPSRFKESLTTNGLVARLQHWDAAKRTLHLQPARYKDQMVSNHAPAHDVIFQGRRVRECAGTSPDWLPFEDSPLGNNVGVAAMVFTSDKRWVLSVRASHPAYEPNKLGCSVSGGLEWCDSLDRGPTAEAWWRDRIISESSEELGFRPRPEEVHFLALAREHQRLGKPQVFLLIELRDISFEAVARFWYLNGDGEHVHLLEVGELDAHHLTTASRYNGHDVAAELRMNLRLALHYMNRNRRPRAPIRSGVG